MTFGTWRWCGQPHAPAAFTPRKCSWYSFSLGAESTPGPWHVGRNISLKSPVTPPGIDPGTVRLVAQRLNHYATQGPAAVIYRYLYTVLLSSGRRKIFFSQTFLCLCGCNLLALHRLRGGGAKQPAREDDHSLLPRLRMSETIPSVPPHALTLPHKNICNRSAMIYWPQPLPLWFFPSIRQLFHLAVDSVLSHNVLLFLRTLLCHVLHLQQSFTHSIVLSFNTKCAGHMPVYSVYCPKLVRVRVQLKCDGTRWRTERKGRVNWRMEWVASTLTLPRNMVYAALLPLMCTPRLPAVYWTDATTELNGLVRFGGRRNLVSARVPSHFKRSLQHISVRCSPCYGAGIHFLPGHKEIVLSVANGCRKHFVLLSKGLCFNRVTHYFVLCHSSRHQLHHNFCVSVWGRWWCWLRTALREAVLFRAITVADQSDDYRSGRAWLTAKILYYRQELNRFHVVTDSQASYT